MRYLKVGEDSYRARTLELVAGDGVSLEAEDQPLNGSVQVTVEAEAGDHDHDGDYEAAGAVATHAADTTSVHGIADTSALATTSGVTSAVSGAISTHEGAGDPHTGYQRESEKGNANGYASLDGSGLVPDAQIPSGITRDSEAAAAYQPLDGDLTAIAALTTTSFGRGLLALADAAALLSAAGAQASDSDLTAIAALTTTSFGRSLLEAANAAALRTLAGTVIGTDVQAQNADLAAIAGLSPSNDHVLQRKAGAWANRTLAQLMTDLAALGTTFQPLDADLTSIAALTTTSYGRALLTLADLAALKSTLGFVQCRKTADQSFSATAFANSTNMALAILASRTYRFRFVVFCETNAATVGIKLGITIPSGATIRWGLHSPAAAPAGGGSALIHASSTATDAEAIAATAGPGTGDSMALIEGVVINSTNAGNIQLRHASETATSTTIFAGSHGEAWEIA